MRDVSDFLINFAHLNNFITENYVFGELKSTIDQSSGSVYGIWIENTQTVLEKLDKILDKINKYQKINNNWIPLYWGKDVTPPSRIRAHNRSSTSTGSINSQLKNLLGNKIIYGSIWVHKYENFEKLLYSNYPAVFGSSTIGKKPATVNILK